MIKISEKLKKKVDAHCELFLEKSLLLKEARDKQITKQQLAIYLVNLEYHFIENVNTIHNAFSIYDEPIIKQFFKEKWLEEQGHEKWTRADLKKLVSKDELQEYRILNSMIEFQDFLRVTMKSQPINYIVFMFYAEYLTVKLGPIWFSGLQNSLGVQKKDVTALTNHIALDDSHSDDVLNFLDSYNISADTEQSCLDYCDELYIKYNNFFDSIANFKFGFNKNERKSNQDLKQVST